MQIAIRLVLLLASVLAGFGAVPVDASAEPLRSAQEFSADIVSRDSSGATLGTNGRLYAAHGKVRIETSDAAAGFFLTDGATATALFVRSRQRVFMDARQSTRLTRIFLPVEPTDPCAQWQAAAKNAGVPSPARNWQCQRTERASVESANIVSASAESTSVDGRDTIEYTVTSPAGEAVHGWIATDLGFPVKWRAADGTTLTLEHIRVEAQPPDLFTVPPDYRKADPQALIDRIKHSDVWAAPPQ
jgi:hypothetical protein